MATKKITKVVQKPRTTTKTKKENLIRDNKERMSIYNAPNTVYGDKPNLFAVDKDAIEKSTRKSKQKIAKDKMDKAFKKAGRKNIK